MPPPATDPLIDDVLGPGGKVARRLGDDYEARPAQLEMARAVARAMRTGRHLLAEAGTGTGKSLAYLVPAAAAALAGKRVVVSTHTISLQEQLYHKDIPLLQSVWGDEFTAVLVKGRGNYLCKRRLASAGTRQRQLFEVAAEFRSLATIDAWSQTTTDGSLSDLPEMPDMRVWEKVRAEAGNCLGKKCPFYDGCFWQAARRRMNTGQMLVVNHALFFSDLALRAAGVQYLPKYDFVIFDEAHTVEDVAASHFGLRAGESTAFYTLRHLYDPERGKGFLPTVAEKIGVGRANAMIETTTHLHTAAENFFSRCVAWKDAHAPANGRVREANVVEDDVSATMTELAKQLRSAAGGVEGDSPEDEGLRLEIAHQATKLDAQAAAIAATVGQTLDDSVYWIETSGRSPRRATLCASPVDVSRGLRTHLFEKIPGVVMTSATLATGSAQTHEADAFGFVKRRLGVPEETSDSLRAASPFDYRTQARLYVETRLPDPGDRRFNEAAAKRVLHWVTRTNGGAFVLFTSYKALIETANRLAGPVADAGLTLLVQGQHAPRHLLLERFRARTNAVLFGTASFWQGVDVRGDTLRNVVIHKLPFAVPDDPIIEARLERIRADGGNPFMAYQVPEAVLKLKQGFGRLIRSKLDTGIVVVLDGRLLTRAYGRTFLQSLPDVEVVPVGQTPDS